ncbi:MAG TPA: methylmalonyl-CoA mutase family protein [Actinomycetes bacterium]|nr:methylmalonyl-CoA mutase family protein [Actinomycetes bacterium]
MHDEPGLKARAVQWRDRYERDGLPGACTDSGIELEPLYLPQEGDGRRYLERLGLPGEWPFVRGVYTSMYRGRLWTIRQYAGVGTADETNARFRYLLERGQTGLSVALDLPTQMGFDSHEALARAEVGRVGVAIDTVEDIAGLFQGIPLGDISVHFTANATAPMILAMFLVAAEEQGVEWSRVRGTVQNDIIKEFIARKAYVFPPRASLRLAGDIIAFCYRQVPKFNPISVTGYHSREAGCNAIQEIAFALLAAIEYVEHTLGRGIRVDEFAPQLSFHFSGQRDLFEEVCKIRAARRLWATIMRDDFGAKDPASMRMRFFCGGSGASLSHAEPLNNVIRGTLQCLAGVLAGAQACHVPSYDEAYAIPSEEAALLSVRTQQIIAYESGVPRVADPLGGSYYVEWLTDRIETEVSALIEKVRASGGLLAALERGKPQEMIRQAAYELQAAEEDGSRLVVGQNHLVEPGSPAAEPAGRGEEVVGVSRGEADRQADRLRAVLARRDAARVEQALARVRAGAGTGDNVMPAMIDAAKARATIGEMTQVLASVLGRHREAGTS